MVSPNDWFDYQVDGKLNPPINMSNQIKGWETFEMKNMKSGGKCLVLELNPSKLQGRYNRAIQGGAKPTFDTYRPHITFCYGYNGKGLPPLPENPTIELIEEYSQPFNPKKYG